MSNTHASTTFYPPRSFGSALSQLAAEVGAFIDAITQPRKLIREVESMADLLAQARRIEATDPQRAAILRRRAARACR